MNIACGACSQYISRSFDVKRHQNVETYGKVCPQLNNFEHYSIFISWVLYPGKKVSWKISENVYQKWRIFILGLLLSRLKIYKISIYSVWGMTYHFGKSFLFDWEFSIHPGRHSLHSTSRDGVTVKVWINATTYRFWKQK